MAGIPDRIDEFEEMYGPWSLEPVNRLEISGENEFDDSSRDEIKRILNDAYKNYSVFYSDKPYFSPSIITRSDVAFYDMSAPRWVLRYHLRIEGASPTHKPEYVGFINVRRKSSFERALKTRHPNGNHSQMEMPPIADALLRFPSGMRVPAVPPLEEFCLIDVELGSEYGEKAFSGAVPYAQPHRYVGGVCVHGVMYMASLLMRQFGLRTYGLADMAKMLGNPTIADGLYPSDILRYFQLPQVTANAFIGGYGKDENSLPDEFDRMAVTTLCACIRSGLPVILYVDAAKLCNLTGKPEKSIEVKKQTGGGPCGHAVLLIGFHRRHEGDWDPTFYYQDTLTAPFQSANLAKLKEAGLNGDFLFVVPVPKEVNLFLGTNWEPPDISNNMIPNLGLLERLNDIMDTSSLDGTDSTWDKSTKRFGFPGQPFFGLGEKSPYDCRYYLLSRSEFVYRYITPNDNSEQKALQELQAKNREKNEYPTWLWVQEWWDWKTADQPQLKGIWVWDATVPKRAYVPDSTLGVRHGNQDVAFCSFPQKPSVFISKKTTLNLPVHPLIRPSLFSNFAPKSGLKDVFETSLCHGVEAIDLYCFTNCQIQEISNELFSRRLDGLQMVEEITANWYSPGGTSDCERVANWIAGLIPQDAEGKARLAIPALASYLPGIAHSEKPRRQKCVKAIKALLWIGYYLNKKMMELRSEGPSVLQLVTGNTWTAALRNSSENQLELDLTDYSLDDKIEWLMESLEELSAVAKETGLTVALELEPGALSVLRDQPSIEKILKAINDPSRRDKLGFVGFNLDIGHYGLAKLSPYEVNLIDGLKDRICHAHVSDFGSGHLGDLCPETVNDGRYFIDWLGCLTDIASIPDEYRVKKNLPKWSGYLSAEMEACRVPDQAFSAYYRTKSLIRRTRLPAWGLEPFDDRPFYFHTPPDA